MKSNIIILGKNGQVASNLIKLFQAKNSKNSFNVASYGSNQADFANLSQLTAFLQNLLINQQEKPHLIINAAAYTNVDKAEDEKELCDLINHQAVEIIANFCAKQDIVLIHYSTDYVFDGSGDEPFTEDNIKNLKPLNYYGKTKLLAEQAIAKSGCKHIIFRISWVYSDNPAAKNFVNTIKKLAKEKEVLNIIDDQIGSPTSAEFVASNTIKIIEKLLETSIKKPLLEKPNQNSNKSRFNPAKLSNISNSIYNLNNGRFISWHQFALEIINNLKEQGEVLQVKEIKAIKTKDYPTKAIRPLNSRLDNKKLSCYFN